MTAKESTRSRRISEGFTIVELLIVVVVIAILAAITIVSYNGIRDRAEAARVAQAVHDYENAVNIYYIQNGSYPDPRVLGSAYGATVCLGYPDQLPDDPSTGLQEGECGYARQDSGVRWVTGRADSRTGIVMGALEEYVSGLPTYTLPTVHFIDGNKQYWDRAFVYENYQGTEDTPTPNVWIGYPIKGDKCVSSTHHRENYDTATKSSYCSIVFDRGPE